MKPMRATLAILLGGAMLVAWMNDPSPEASRNRQWMSSLLVFLFSQPGR